VVVAVALAAVLAGCSLPLGSGAGDPAVSGDLGVEDGVRYNDSIAVTPGDGLNESERRALIDRSMARLELLRGLEFTADVPVSVINRSQYRANQSGGTDPTYSRWNNQVWEGLFLVGEDENVSRVFQQTLGNVVLGYYSPADDEIVVVSDSATPEISRGTLVHELVHALQDQQFGLNESFDSQDRQLARNGVVEGEAVLLNDRYKSRCDGEWDCVFIDSNSGGVAPNPGVFLVLAHPYSTGPNFVERVQQREGWAAVDAMHERYPPSTEQLIHPDRYPDERPVNVTVPDRARDGWTRFDIDPVADTVGEASIFAMLVQNDAGDESVSRYSYVHPASDGWAGDTLVPYRDGDRYGYVWETAWDSGRDARQFADAYRDLLAGKGARQVAPGTYVVETGPFAVAFRVVREGSRVRVVNGPDTDALAAIHPAP
jgi:hypothetical protein